MKQEGRKARVSGTVATPPTEQGRRGTHPRAGVASGTQPCRVGRLANIFSRHSASTPLHRTHSIKQKGREKEACRAPGGAGGGPGKRGLDCCQSLAGFGCGWWCFCTEELRLRRCCGGIIVADFGKEMSHQKLPPDVPASSSSPETLAALTSHLKPVFSHAAR